jgi:hypothetical protein
VSAEVWLNPTNLTAFVSLEAEFATLFERQPKLSVIASI